MTTGPLLNHRYKILRALAEGGFGKTFLAEDTQMPSKRRCVIKQLKPVSSRPEIAQIVQDRFTREAAVLDAVGKNHDQIPTLYAYFVTAGQFYLVQEWIDGEPLQVAAHKVLSAERARQMLKDLLPAIAHVHSNNVIHRDIKPDNIIIRNTDQRPCLIDFGAVKELMGTVVSPGGLAKSSIIIGTAGYMPQEQAAGRPTFSSDLYSLGMTTICVLVGKHPAAIPTDSRTGQRLWQQYMPTIHPALAEVLNKAIHPYPQHRYRSADEMLAALSGTAVHMAKTTPATVTHSSKPTELSTQGIRPPAVPTEGFPVKGAAIAATAFAVGAGLLIAVRPTPNIDTVVSAKQQQTTPPVSETNSDTLPRPEERPDEPTSAEDFTNRATLLYGQGRLAQAQQDIEAALALDPNSLAALSLKGDILANQSRIDLPGAIAAYTQALTLGPNNPDLLQKRCTAYQQNTAFDLAHQDCTQLLTITPNSATLYDQRGDIRNAQENYPGAIADYTQAIEINERDGNPSANQSIYYSRGTAYAANGDPGKGLEDFEKMREQ